MPLPEHATETARRNTEGGYALLAILLGAVLMSVFLVRALPREAMSAQRIREQRLIDRGEEYSRAIKLYFREHKKYPKRLDDLEETNRVRYLRKRYKDPISGEDEWRLIHVGADGRFKDSLIYDTEDPNERLSADGRMGAGGSGFGQRSGSARSQQNQPMDAKTYQELYGTPRPPQPGVFAGADLARQTQESAAPDNPLLQAHLQFSMEAAEQGGGLNNPEAAGLGPDGRPLPANQQQPADYSRLSPGQVPTDAGQRPIPGQPLPPGYAGQQPAGPGGSRGSIGARNSRQGALGGAPQPGFNQQPPVTPGAFAGANVSADAAAMIGRLLTTPRPGGLAGIQGQGAMQAGAPAAAFEEGIAGVASKAEQFGVKVYKGKNTYNEWEFVYDYRKDMQMGGMPTTPGGGGNINPNQPGLTPGGGLSNIPAMMMQPPSGPQPEPPAQIPPTPADPRMTQFGGQSPVPQLPPTDPGNPYAPQEPVQENPAPEGELTPPLPTQEPEPAESPNRTYQLPRSRRTPGQP